MSRHSGNLASIDVKMTEIKWKDEDGNLPESEEYSIGLPTLVENLVFTEDGNGLDLVYDGNALDRLLKDMLKEDYGAEVAGLAFRFSVVRAQALD